MGGHAPQRRPRPPLSFAPMSDRITRDEVIHVARLARLELAPDEVDAFTEQLARVLEHAADVESLEVDDVAPTSHPLPLANVYRADEVTPSIDRDEVLAQAPFAEDHMFRVPPVLGEEP